MNMIWKLQKILVFRQQRCNSGQIITSALTTYHWCKATGLCTYHHSLSKVSVVSFSASSSTFTTFQSMPCSWVALKLLKWPARSVVYFRSPSKWLLVLSNEVTDAIGSNNCHLRRFGGRSTTTEWIAVALHGQERSPQPTQQEAQFRLRPAANRRHQNY